MPATGSELAATADGELALVLRAPGAVALARALAVEVLLAAAAPRGGELAVGVYADARPDRAAELGRPLRVEAVEVELEPERAVNRASLLGDLALSEVPVLATPPMGSISTPPPAPTPPSAQIEFLPSSRQYWMPPPTPTNAEPPTHHMPVGSRRLAGSAFAYAYRLVGLPETKIGSRAVKRPLAGS